MKHLTWAALFAAVCAVADEADAATVIINGQTAGPTPFIRQMQLTANPPASNSIAAYGFRFPPKQGR